MPECIRIWLTNSGRRLKFFATACVQSLCRLATGDLRVFRGEPPLEHLKRSGVAAFTGRARLR